ncbi:MAG: signal peptidase I [Planctomycetes bacterium]|nr:signal peptidase I [Planctomycetota bacterium]
MTSTAILLATFCILLAVSLLLQAIFLRWGVKWASGSVVTLRKALLVAFVLQFAALAIGLCAYLFEARLPRQGTATVLAELVLQIVVPCAIVAISFKLTFLRGVQAWLPTLIPGIALIAFSYLVLRPYMYEAFVVPTNAMAPTILGNHAIGACPRCGAPAYASPPDAWSVRQTDGLVMICSKELKPCNVLKFTESGGPDRILVNKLITPRRWDLIVFRLPSDPSINYVKRLVGLPGEELLIRDGAVWINGEKLEPPEELRGIEYLSSIEFGNQTREAAGTSPLKLAGDECFVLGDFSAQSADSRFWEMGAPGHPPYAVPESHIVGVVTHIYWPISRWRSFR